MKRFSCQLAAAVLLSGCGTAAPPADKPSAKTSSTPASPLATITSASIELPVDEETFAAVGQQGDLLDRTCLACHSAAMVRQQPPLSRKQWTATVTKMREAYGAPFEASQTEAIVDALMKAAPSKP